MNGLSLLKNYLYKNLKNHLNFSGGFVIYNCDNCVLTKKI